MIKHMRVDSRLIHGQVASAWMNHIGAKEIIVCNDIVAQDRIQKMALPLAARGAPVKVFSIQETIDFVTSEARKMVEVANTAYVKEFVSYKAELLYFRMCNLK